VNGLCCNYSGFRRLAVHERCTELVRDLEECAWALDANENTLPILSERDKARGHISAALRYLIAFEFPLKGRIGPKSGFLG
jgi:hypothetical protein